MSEKRQHRMIRVIKEVVSECFMQLSDPRVTGFISVTEVKLTPDCRQAEIVLRIFANTENEKKNTFKALQHARGHIQTVLAGELNIRFCPIIRFSLDDKMEKTIDTLRLIEQVSEELAQNAAENQTDSDAEEGGQQQEGESEETSDDA